MRYLLDTNICIYLGRTDLAQLAGVRKRFASLQHGDAVMSVVTYAELRHGIERSGHGRLLQERVLEQLVQQIPVLPLDREVAELYGRLAAQVPRQQRNAFDCLIAAHALAVGVTLVTNNERDFSGYPDLVVENWARL